MRKLYYSFHRIKTIVSAALLSFVCICSTSSQASIFSIEGDSSSDKSVELGDLFRALYNTDKLPVRNYTIDESDNDLKQILVDSGVLDSELEITETLASVLCDLNTHVCERLRVVSLFSNTQSIGGYEPSSAAWSFQVGDEVLIPSAVLSRSREITFEYKAIDVKIDELVIDSLKGCESFDEKCRSLVERLNPSLKTVVFDDKFGGFLNLPKETLSLELGFPESAASDVSSERVSMLTAFERRDGSSIELQSISQESFIVVGKKIIPSSRELIAKSDEEISCSNNSFKCDRANNLFERFKGSEDDGVATAIYESVFQEIKQETSNDDLIYLQNKAGAGGTGVRFSTQPRLLMTSDFEIYRKSLRDWIKFPYAELEHYPPEVSQAKIAVFDSWVDAEHCSFKNAKSEARLTTNNIIDRQISPRLNCDSSIKASDGDHGTWVTGLLLADSPVHLGLAPKSSVVTYEVDLARLKEPSYMKELSESMALAYIDHGSEVINISLGYVLDPPESSSIYSVGGAKDFIQGVIENQKDYALFVAAAGNYGNDTSSICDIRPACFDYPNLISVAALDTTQGFADIWRSGSNYSSNYGANIDIAAPGVGLLSTVTGGAFGMMSGTSQSAPQVSSIAAMYMAMNPGSSPLEVKNRLISCSNNVGNYEGRLFGGELDAGCVLQKQAFYSTANDKDDQKHFSIGGASDIHFKKSDGTGRKLSIPSSSIRAIHRVKRNNSYTVFYSENAADRNSKLLKSVSLRFVEGLEIEMIKPVTGDVITVRGADLHKYVAAG